MSRRLVLWLLLCGASSRATALQCWQCASVDNRRCPDESKMVDSVSHDACITWRLGNGTVILQNVVMFENECTPTKIDFWTRFIDLYYQTEGGEVRCCDTDGCNTGSFSDDFFLSHAAAAAAAAAGQSTTGQNVPGAPLIFGAVSSAPSAFAVTTPPTPLGLLQQQQQQQQQALPSASLAAALSLGLPGSSPFVTTRQSGQQQQPQQPQQLQQLQQLQPQPAGPGFGLSPSNLQVALSNLQQSASVAAASDFGLSGFPQVGGGGGGANGLIGNGNCGKYFSIQGDGEWLPTTLMPLSFDRASETKVGVFYAKFNAQNGNNDHVIVRLVNKNRSNTTMYSFKLYRVGSVSLFVSKLEPNNNQRVGGFNRNEIRKASVNAGVNLTDTTRHMGFWFTIKGDELALGAIGDQLIDPVLIWNDTLREGPRDVQYFALTTDQSVASFGVNCDVPNLHFSDTCVTDEDCEAFPNTVCSAEPVNKGLDPGTRDIPFEDWEPRDTLLKSCFCREGHVRIPLSKGCYDPIRQVVTLKDACFADYHCNDLPNTHCVFDKNVAHYNKSCQCVPGNKPFDTDPRTGLIEGCAPLTDADKASVLGCATKLRVEDNFEWVPDDVYPLEHDSGLGVDVGVVFVKIGPNVNTRNNNGNEAAIIRLLDERKNPRKFYTVKFYRHTGKISLSESTRQRSFFFENERDAEKVSVDEVEVMTRMQVNYVGFWIQYRYEEGLGGTLSVGLNGSPFSPDYALVRWTDTADNALRGLSYIGFTGTAGATADFGTSCVLLDTPIGVGTNPFVQLNAQQQQTAVLNQFASPSQTFPGASIGSVFGNNLNRVNPNLAVQQQQQLQNLQSLQSLAGLAAVPNFGNSLATAQLAALAQQQQQQQQQAALNPWDLLGRRSASSPLQAQDITPDASAGPDQSGLIIEPDLRSPYLTKLQRLLPPTLFDDLSPLGLGEKSAPSASLLTEVDKASGSPALLDDDSKDGSTFDEADYTPLSEAAEGK